MERILQKKLIVVCVSVVFVVLTGIAAVINIMNYLQIEKDTDAIISYIIDNDGQFPRDFSGASANLPNRFTQETSFTTRYFTVMLDEEGEILSVDTNNVIAVSIDDAYSYGTEIMELGKTSGTIDAYQYQKVESEEGYLIVFVDYSEELYIFQSFLVTSVFICAIALVGVFILVLLLSKRAVAPIVKSYEKQKQFITDMSHEIKTPLAIIKANTEVLELVSGESEWSQSIHTQVTKLADLVTALLSLAKLNENNEDVLVCEFSISDAIQETVDLFEILAEDKTISANLEKNISYEGDEQGIRRLISILVENAIKYGAFDSDIKISMIRKKDKICIECTNAVERIDIGNYDKWFERFYREENSRNSDTGGFGIGLAMAKSIVKKHGGKISAESIDGKNIRFRVELLDKKQKKKYLNMFSM